MQAHRQAGPPRASSFSEGLTHDCSERGSLLYLASAAPTAEHCRRHYGLGSNGKLAIGRTQV
jgi:hypothetical protein